MDRTFFNRKADEVAYSLLGHYLIRTINGEEKKAIIVETEAYFDKDDPASRACFNGDICETMHMKGGTILVYGVHNNWLINIVTGKPGEAAAVLIRAVEPVNFDARTHGPGLLTKALLIDKTFHKKNIFDSDSLRMVVPDKHFAIEKSFRIGVKKDLPRHLRFYLKDNKWVSRT